MRAHNHVSDAACAHAAAQRIRKSLLELAGIRSTPHPLLDESFETDRVNLCIRDAEAVVSDLAAEYQVDTAVLEDALR